MASVSLINIEKRYGAQVVIPKLNVEIADGSFVVLVGPSGCGKTTTLNMIAGLEPITAGQLLIGARDVTDLPPKNRDIAMKVLKSQLYEQEIEKRRAALRKLDASKPEISFGSQIRSYVMQPYQLIKDHRTKVERGDVQKVLDGDIDPFIRAYLLYRRDAA